MKDFKCLTSWNRVIFHCWTLSTFFHSAMFLEHSFWELLVSVIRKVSHCPQNEKSWYLLGNYTVPDHLMPRYVISSDHQNCFKIYWVLYSYLWCFWSVVSTYLWSLLLPTCVISSQLNYLPLPKYAPLIGHIYNFYYSMWVNAFYEQ